MQSDQFIILNYEAFKKDTLPMLNLIEDKEEAILAQIGMFNKRKKYNEIADLYKGYYDLVMTSWKQIYSTEREFDETARNLTALMDGNSFYAETTIQVLVEQFYYCVGMVLTPIIMRYKGQQIPDEADQVSDAAKKVMLQLMSEIEQEEAKLIKQEKASAKLTILKNGNEANTSKSLSPAQEALIEAREEYEDVLINCSVPIEDMNFSVRLYNVLKRAGINKVSDICDADPLSLRNLGVKNVDELIEAVLRRTEKNSTLQRKNPESNNFVQLKEKVLKLAEKDCVQLYTQSLEVEKDYDRLATQINLFADFASFEQRWSEINIEAQRVEKQVSHIRKEWLSMDDSTGNREYRVLMHEMLDWCIVLQDYSSSMENLMHNLWRKSHGEDYTFEEYQNELEVTGEKSKANKKAFDLIKGAKSNL